MRVKVFPSNDDFEVSPHEQDGIDISVHPLEDDFNDAGSTEEDPMSDEDQGKEHEQDLSNNSDSNPEIVFNRPPMPNNFADSSEEEEIPRPEITSEQTRVVIPVPEVVRDNPEIAQYLEMLVDHRVDDRIRARDASQQSDVCKQMGKTMGKPDKVDKPRGPGNHITKSPSESTIYVPALREVASNLAQEQVIDQITHFVEGIQMEVQCNKHQSGQSDNVETTPVSTTKRLKTTTHRQSSPRPGTSNEDEPIQRADQILLDAEKFKGQTHSTKRYVSRAG